MLGAMTRHGNARKCSQHDRWDAVLVAKSFKEVGKFGASMEGTVARLESSAQGNSDEVGNLDERRSPTSTFNPAVEPGEFAVGTSGLGDGLCRLGR